MDTDMDARVPMLRMYSRCTGDTLRRPASERSIVRAASAASTGTSGTGT